VQLLPIILGMFLAQWAPGASFKTIPDFSGTPPHRSRGSNRKQAKLIFYKLMMTYAITIKP